jgi:hypothetical protein
MAKILYNNYNPFDGVSTLPLVERSSAQTYRNSLDGTVTKITLHGRLRFDDICNAKEYILDSSGNRIPNGSGGYLDTGRVFADRLEVFLYARERIISAFSSNFKSLKIYDNDNALVYTGNYCLIREINFDEDRYYNLVPYSISLDVIEGEFASIGIMEPNETFVYDNNGNSSGTLTHSVSCKGFNTNLSAIQNAENFIATKKGTFPNYSLYSSPYYYFLRSSKTTVNRFTGECSLEEVVIYNHNNSPELLTSCVTSYSVDIKQTDKKVSITISGKLTGDVDYPISDMRSEFVAIDWYAIASAEYEFGSDLSTKPVEFSTKEDDFKKELSFVITYSNEIFSGPYLIDSTTINRNNEDNSICIKFRGVIKSDYGCKDKRLEDIKTYYASLDIESIVAAKYAEYVSPAIPLNSKTKSRSFSESRSEPSISFEVLYCNLKGEKCGCLDSFDYQLSYKPAIPLYSANPAIEGLGCYYVQDLGINRRSSFSISGTALVSDCCTYERAVEDLRSKINQILAENYTPAERVMDSYSIVKNKNGKTITFDVSWSGFETCPLPSNLKTC